MLRLSIRLSALVVAICSLGFSSNGQQGNNVACSELEAMSEGIDLFVERMVHLGKAMNEKDWEVVREIYQAVDRKAKDLGYPGFKGADYFKLAVLVRDKAKHEDLFPVRKRALVRGVAGRTLGESLILCSGDVMADPGAISNCVIFANGQVRCAASIGGSIVICNGDIEVVDGNVGQSVLIAKGDIKAGSLYESVAISGGNIDVDGFIAKSHVSSAGYVDATGFIRASTVVSKKVVTADEIKKDSTIREKVQSLPKLVRFFDTAAIGIEFERVQGGILVFKLARESKFATAGMSKGDQVVAIDSVGVFQVEDARNLLRKALIQGRATISSRRDGKALHCSVEFTKK